MIARRFAVVVLAMLCLACVQGARAHDIPADVRINAFVKPVGDKLQMLVRVPMAALLSVDFPVHGRGYLDVSRADEALRIAAKLWLIDYIDVYENGTRLSAPEIVKARVSLPSNKSFTSLAEGLAHLQDPPLADDLDLFWKQQMMDVLLAYPIESERSKFAIDSRWNRLGLRVTTTLRFLPPDGSVRAFDFEGAPGLIPLDPRWNQAAQRFMVQGFWHILGGVDHLLFLLCLVAPFGRLYPLLVLVTSFTVGHLISLTAAAFGFVPDTLWFPPLIETLIAATIVYMALENIVFTAVKGDASAELRRRWLVTFIFGLVHGFGFWFLMRGTLQFAGEHLPAALLSLNVGIEIGQVAALLVLVPVLRLIIFGFVVPERLGIVILSALVVHTAWHWMIDYGDQLLQFPFPAIDFAFLAGVLRALLAALILGVGVVFVDRWLKRVFGMGAGNSPAAGESANKALGEGA